MAAPDAPPRDDAAVFDVAIVGAGIAGAALAWRLVQPDPGQRSVLLLEAEPQPGLHTTGRSAAMFMESYGPPAARALTRASRAFYQQPPAGFADAPLVAPRGALYVAAPGEQALWDDSEAALRATGTAIERLDAAAARHRVPCLRPERLIGALYEPGALDIDVHALHQGFLRGARRGGAALWLAAELARAEPGPPWVLHLADGRRARARVLVDAAGAWADEVARRAGMAPAGLQPCRRSAFTFAAPAGMDSRGWPVVANLDEAEGWYFKPDAGRLLGSPANADPTVPHDVRPEELDVAIGIDRIERATTLAIARPLATWAGLRTFAPDGELLIGPEPGRADFFWLAGQGGYGIQSAHGAAELAAALLTGRPLPEALVDAGVRAEAMAPRRSQVPS